MKSQSSGWASLREILEANWESYIEIDSEIFSDFNKGDWKNLQEYLRQKTGHFLECRTLAEFESQVKLSEQVSQGYMDSIEPLEEALKEFLKELDPDTQSQVMMAVVGTLSKLPYGEPSSGSSYSFEIVENVELELRTLVDVLKIGSEDNLIGDSFDDHLWAIDLLSDCGRSFLVPFLGETDSEEALLKSWGPRPGVMCFDMTAAMTVALRSNLFNQFEKNLINPRYIHLLIDDSNLTQPWWMDMGLWASAAEIWKDISGIDTDDLDFDALALAIRGSLNRSNYPSDDDFEVISQDADMFTSLLEFLE